LLAVVVPSFVVDDLPNIMLSVRRRRPAVAVRGGHGGAAYAAKRRVAPRLLLRSQLKNIECSAIGYRKDCQFD
jgi:hypothetical protein